MPGGRGGSRGQWGIREAVDPLEGIIVMGIERGGEIKLIKKTLLTFGTMF